MGRIHLRSNKSKQVEAALRKAVLVYQAQPDGNERKSLRDIADGYEVAYVTLWRKMKRGKSRVVAHQSEQKVMAGEEKTLRDWIYDLDDCGLTLKVGMVKDIVRCNRQSDDN